MTLQQLNLDWLLDQMKKIMQLLPFNGVAGDVLQRTVDGAAWMPLGAVSMDIHGLTSTTPATNDELPIYDNDLVGNYKVTVQDLLDMVPAAPVTSVNGQTGAVSLAIPTDTADLTNTAGFVDAAGAAAAAPVQSVNGQTGAVITKDLFFDNDQDAVTISIDNVLDPSNDSTIDQQTVVLMKDPDKKIIRLCGWFRMTSGANNGWRSFVTNVQDIADLPAGKSYVHCDWTCDLYKIDTGLRWYSSTGSACNYRVRSDKTIVIYVYFPDPNTSYRVVFNAVPVQISY